MDARLTGCGGLVALAGIVLGLAGSALPARATLAPDVGSYGSAATPFVVQAPQSSPTPDGNADVTVTITGFPSTTSQSPEPASAVTGLLGMGLLSLAAWRRRRKRRPRSAELEGPGEVG